ncbi:MAG: sigma-70 family RNA polymerase sigma factor [Ktedonobacteraceae bacterium]
MSFYDYYELGAYEQYLAHLHRTPAIDRERDAALLEQLQLAKEHAQTGSHRDVADHLEACRAELVERYQLLVFSIARRYQWLFKHLELLDVIQEGNVGLLRAIDTYDARSSKPFVAHASVHIKGAIFKALYGSDAPIRFPQYVYEQYHTLLRVRTRFWRLHGREATESELASVMGISEAKVADLLDLRRLEQGESLQALMTFDSEGHVRCPEVVNMVAPSVNDDGMRPDRVQDALQNALGALSERGREVIRLRYGLDGEVYTWSEVAERIGANNETCPRYVAQQAEVQLFDALKLVVLEVCDDSVVHPLAAVTSKPTTIARVAPGAETTNKHTLRARRRRERLRLFKSQAIAPIVA